MILDLGTGFGQESKLIASDCADVAVSCKKPLWFGYWASCVRGRKLTAHRAALIHVTQGNLAQRGKRESAFGQFLEQTDVSAVELILGPEVILGCGDCPILDRVSAQPVRDLSSKCSHREDQRDCFLFVQAKSVRRVLRRLDLSRF